MPVRHPPIAAATAIAPDAPSLDWGPLRLLVGASAQPVEVVEEVDWDDHMRRYGRRVIVALIARGILPEQAKELAQDAWMRVIQNHRRGKLVDLKLPGIVIAQANFLALDDGRRAERRFGHDPLGASHHSIPADGNELEGRVAARHQLRKIQAVIERAHPNARRVFEMLYSAGAASAEEVAAELGISVQRVRQITCELRKKIRLALADVSDPSGGVR